MGREGPMVHIAACLFYFTGRQFHNFGRIRSTDPGYRRRCGGSGGGVQCATGRIVLVLEELAEQHFHQFKTTVISAVIVAGMVAQWLSGRYLFSRRSPNRLCFCKFRSHRFAVGIVCGLGAEFFQKSSPF